MVIDSVAKFNHRKLRSAIKLPAQNFRHLRLFCFDYYALSWRFSNCLLATLSNLFQAHQKQSQSVMTAFGGPDRYRPGVQRIVQQPSTNSLLLCLIRFHFCAGRNNAIIILINFFNHSPTSALWIQK